MVGAEVTAEFASGVENPGKNTGAETVCTKAKIRTVTSERAIRRRLKIASLTISVLLMIEGPVRPRF